MIREGRDLQLWINIWQVIHSWMANGAACDIPSHHREEQSYCTRPQPLTPTASLHRLPLSKSGVPAIHGDGQKFVLLNFDINYIIHIYIYYKFGQIICFEIWNLDALRNLAKPNPWKSLKYNSTVGKHQKCSFLKMLKHQNCHWYRCKTIYVKFPFSPDKMILLFWNIKTLWYIFNIFCTE